MTEEFDPENPNPEEAESLEKLEEEIQEDAITESEWLGGVDPGVESNSQGTFDVEQSQFPDTKWEPEESVANLPPEPETHTPEEPNSEPPIEQMDQTTGAVEYLAPVVEEPEVQQSSRIKRIQGE